MGIRKITWICVFIATAMMLFGCQKTYYAVWEKLGKEKRHLLRDQVQKARADQEKASEEFKDALTRVKEIYGFKGGKLEKFYNRLQDDYSDCEHRTQIIDERIARVEQTATDLFKEWQQEIDEIGNPKFKAKSRQSLLETKKRYRKLQSAMKQARAKMTPVLKQLKDYVLYLKHNLNAQAVGALGKEVQSITIEVDDLIADLTASIKAADDFLKDFE